MIELKEYVVTAKDRISLDDLCHDIEHEGGDLYIPNRKVEIAKARLTSRNTHYYLTDEEAVLLRNDPRVLAVNLTPAQLGMKVRPSWTQSSENWSKSSEDNANHNNWGLLRCILGEQLLNWGDGGTINQNRTVQISSEGRNVDVVVVDGMIDPAHPELAVNSNGTGGSRVVQYNWFQHSESIEGFASTPYVYAPYIDENDYELTSNNNHGVHVAGTIAGNTQGWARSANVYNINPYSTDINGLNALYIFDYIREFHSTKPINPVTGRKNPTICNNSWGYSYTIPITEITSVVVKGVTYEGPFTANELAGYGMNVFEFDNIEYAVIPAEYPALDADIEDAIAEGIIMVGAAGNDSTKIDVQGGEDYDNAFLFNVDNEIYSDYYHRGSSPSRANGHIVVGALSTTINESKAGFSNCGPRVDIFAPGSSINSSVHTEGVADSRNANYQLSKYNGTSMASPQVCGALACVLEVYPNMTPAKAMEYIKYYAKVNQITDTGGGYTDYFSLQGAGNRYLFYYREREVSGKTWPKVNYGIRSSSKIRFPRNPIRRTR
jgi:subtilisin family serine protease